MFCLASGSVLGCPPYKSRCFVYTRSDFFQNITFRVGEKLCFSSGAAGMDPEPGPAMPQTSHNPGPRVAPGTGHNSNMIVLRRRERRFCRKMSVCVDESTISAGRDPLEIPVGQNRCAFRLHEKLFLFGHQARVLPEAGPASATGPATDTSPAATLAPGLPQQ